MSTEDKFHFAHLRNCISADDVSCLRTSFPTGKDTAFHLAQSYISQLETISEETPSTKGRVFVEAENAPATQKITSCTGCHNQNFHDYQITKP